MPGSEFDTQAPRPPNPPWRRWLVRAGITIGAAAAAWLLGSATAAAAPVAPDGTPDASSVGAPAPLLSPALAPVDDAVVGIRTALAPASGTDLTVGHDLGGGPANSEAWDVQEQPGLASDTVTALFDSVGDAAPAVTTTDTASRDLIDATTTVGTTLVDDVTRTARAVADAASDTVTGTVTAIPAGLRHAVNDIDDVIRSTAGTVTRTVSSIVAAATEAVDGLYPPSRIGGTTPAGATSPPDISRSAFPDPDGGLPQEHSGAQSASAAVETDSPPAMASLDVRPAPAAPVTTGSTTGNAVGSGGRSALPQMDLRSTTDIPPRDAPGHPLRQPTLPAVAPAANSGAGSASSGQSWVACTANAAPPREDSVTTTASSGSPPVLDRSHDPGFSPG